LVQLPGGRCAGQGLWLGGSSRGIERNSPKRQKATSENKPQDSKKKTKKKTCVGRRTGEEAVNFRELSNKKGRSRLKHGVAPGGERGGERFTKGQKKRKGDVHVLIAKHEENLGVTFERQRQPGPGRI